MLNENLSYIEMIKKLQKKIENIRNVCVLAHVDHGKTSLVDSLISYNNIINPRVAGQIRIMDFRKDEQERCITMKSSSISIVFDSQVNKENYLINLIDSPGHVDFTSEVSSALKVCDGAIILIDVVEGICSQTESVLRQAWNEKIKCVLVLNKIDRLISEIQMDPFEAYIYLVNLLEKTNSLMGSLIVRDINVESENKEKYKQSHKDSGNDLVRKDSEENIEIDVDYLIQEKENELYFSPDKGNVVFSSATDCWGFTLESFSEILTKTTGFKKEIITKLLWGDYYFNKTNKKVYKCPVNSNSKPMFVEFVLNNIYKLYKLALVDKNLESITKAATTLNVELIKNELSIFDKNPRPVLKTIMRQWLKLPNTVFEMTVQFLPDPRKGALNKFNILFPSNIYPSKNCIVQKFKSFLNRVEIPNKKFLNEENNEIKEKEMYFLNESPILAFISKMVPINLKNISDENISCDKNLNEIRYMAFARAYCGTIKKGQEYFVIGPKHDPKSNYYDIKKYKFDNLYLFMGQNLEAVNEVPPGNIFSVSGLENYVFKTATISSQFECPRIKPSLLDLNSIIKVCIVTEELKEMPLLIEGLKKLNRSDPAVEYYVQKNGEHILVTSGEVHLERCIKDLEDHLAKVRFKISAPMVNFKEGLANLNYQFKKKNLKNDKKNEKEKIKEDEKKKDLNKRYILDEGDANIDIDNEKEILNSSKPMVITEKVKIKKPEKVKNKVVDIKNKSEKTNFYIEKNLKSQMIVNFNGSNLIKESQEINQNNFNKSLETNNIKGFAEDTTPNKLCSFVISAVGMNEEQIEFLEKNQEIMSEVTKRDFCMTEQLYENFIIFKQNLLDLFDNKRLRQLIEKNLYSFGPLGSGKNMLLIKNIRGENCYFNRIKKENKNILSNEEEEEMTDSRDIEIKDEKNTILTNNTNNINLNINNSLNEETHSITSETISRNFMINCSKSIDQNSSILKSHKKQKNLDIELESTIEEQISTMKNTITPNEFLNSVKSGFELALLNGPLCEEEMYGVIFIIEEINLHKPVEIKIKDQLNNVTENISYLNGNQENNKDGNKETNKCDFEKNLDDCETNDKYMNLIKLESDLKEKMVPINENLSNTSGKDGKNDLIEEKTGDEKSLSSKQLNSYGPFIGQITGTIKDCCRKAFLNSEPRLYEALYLCLFQIKQESIGKIHSVINKRRGKIINELSNDEGMICTIEAHVPIVESFGFVEEIRKKSSGMANPMLTFHKWEMIDIDPFYAPTTQEEIQNFGVNIDTPNIAKNYINKVRIRKGLPVDEKLVKHSDKQKNLSKKK